MKNKYVSMLALATLFASVAVNFAADSIFNLMDDLSAEVALAPTFVNLELYAQNLERQRNEQRLASGLPTNEQSAQESDWALVVETQ